MAEKNIPVLLDQTQVQISVGAAIEREELYGAQKLSVERDGTPLEKVVVSPWGALFDPKEFSNQSVDSQGTLEQKPVACDENGSPLPMHASSFKEARILTPAKWEELASFRAVKVMPAKCELPAGLYKTSFCYRDSVNLEDAFLVVRQDGAFLLAGETRLAPMQSKEEVYSFFETDEQDSDDSEGLGFESL